MKFAKSVVKKHRGKFLHVHLPLSKKSDGLDHKCNNRSDLISGEQNHESKVCKRLGTDQNVNGEKRRLSVDVDDHTSSSCTQSLLSQTHTLQRENESASAFGKTTIKTKTRSFFNQHKRKQAFFRRITSKTQHVKRDSSDMSRNRSRIMSIHSSIERASTFPKRVSSWIQDTESIDSIDRSEYEFGRSDSMGVSWDFDRIIDEDESGPKLDLVAVDPSKPYWIYANSGFKVQEKLSTNMKGGIRTDDLQDFTEEIIHLEQPPRTNNHVLHHSEGILPVGLAGFFESQVYSGKNPCSTASFGSGSIPEDPKSGFDCQTKSKNPCAQDSLFESVEFICDELLNLVSSQSSYILSLYWAKNNDDTVTQQRQIVQKEPSDMLTLSDLGMLSATAELDTLSADEEHDEGTQGALDVCGTRLDALFATKTDFDMCMDNNRHPNIPKYITFVTFTDETNVSP